MWDASNLRARRWANLLAVLVSTGVLGLALYWIFFEAPTFPETAQPRENEIEGRTITVVEEITDTPEQQTTKETQKGVSGPSPDTESTTETTTTPASEATKFTTTTVDAPPDTSVWGRTLATPGVIPLLQIGIAALSAFLAGAVVQRIALGAYGVKIGSFELAELPTVTKEELTSTVDVIKDPPRISSFLPPGPPAQVPFPQFWYVDDERDKLVSIRIEVEEQLRKLAETLGIDRELALEKILKRLADSPEPVITETARESLREFLSIGDRVIRGAKVEREAASGIQESAMMVIYSLMDLVIRAKRREFTVG